MTVLTYTVTLESIQLQNRISGKPFYNFSLKDLRKRFCYDVALMVSSVNDVTSRPYFAYFSIEALKVCTIGFLYKSQ